jgi:RNA-binding protein
MEVFMSEENNSLTGKQRRFLRALGNKLEDRVIIGHSGISPACLHNIRTFLRKEELIKVRLQPSAGLERNEVSVLLASESESEVVQVFGSTILLYKENLDEKKIKLP